VDMSKSQRHTRSGADRRVSQANEAAIYPKLAGLCQHEIFSGIMKKWKQCGTVKASYGCLVGHVCMGVRISGFAHNSATVQFQVLMSTDCLFYKGADWYPFCPGRVTTWGV